MTSATDYNRNSDMLAQLDVQGLLDFLSVCHEDSIVPLVYGRPGIGKTEIVGQWASANGFALLDERLAYRLPEQIGSIILPDHVARETVRLKPGLIQRIEVMRAATKQPVLVFLDEITLAARDVASVTLELLNERRIDGVPVPADTFLVAAGNLPSHTAAAAYLDAPVRSRVAAVSFEPSIEDFTDYLEKTVPSVTTAALKPWLESDEGRRIVDAVGHADGASPICTRRSVLRALSSIAKRTKKGDTPAIAFGRMRTISQALCGLEFESKATAHLTVSAVLVSAAEVIAQPKQAPIPPTAQATMAQLATVLAYLKGNSSPANMVESFVVYLKRIPASQVSSWLSSISVTDPGVFAKIASTKRGASLIEDTGVVSNSGGARAR